MKDLHEQAKEYLSRGGYGTGTNFTTGMVADLMVRFYADKLQWQHQLRKKEGWSNCLGCGHLLPGDYFNGSDTHCVMCDFRCGEGENLCSCGRPQDCGYIKMEELSNQEAKASE